MGPPTRLSAALRTASSWAWVLPHLVLGGFVAALFALLAVLASHEKETRRDALARDIQWAEQAMRTQLLSNEAFLGVLAGGIAAGQLTREAFEAKVEEYVDQHDELALVAWVDADQVIRWSAPFEDAAWNSGERLSVPEETLAFQRASRNGTPGYAVPPPARDDEGATIEVHVPVLDERRSLGAVVGVYRADGLVRRLAPAWFSEKYRIVLETEDRVLAANSSVVPRTDLTDRMSLDPPGQGLRLRVSAFAAESRLKEDMLVATSAGLVLLIAWSVWGLTLHMRRRRQAERERDQLFNLSLDLLCVLRLDGSIVRASPAFERVLGLSPEALRGSLPDLVHPDDREATRAELAKLARGAPTQDFHNRCRAAGGSYRWLAWSVNPVVEEGLLYCVGHDITDRKRSDEAIRRESAFRKAMEESVITGLRAVDLEGRITFVNPAFCEMVGFPAEELLGRVPPFPYWPEEEIPTLSRVTEGWLRGDSPREGFEVQIMRRSGERFPARMYISPLVGDDGRQTGWMASMIDITEQRRAEELGRQTLERVQQTSRLIAMGEMASSIAHELNQPLAAIANYCSGSVSRLSADGFEREEVLAAMRKASAQADRAGKIIRRVRDFVNKREPNRARVPLAEVVEDAIGFAQLDARKAGVEIEVDVPAELPQVFVDRVMIEQVVLNLVKNGVEAMHPPCEGRELRVVARPGGEGLVELAVADRGRGFPPEDAEKLFAPFYTTKGDGMGMGLSICRSIVEFHGGRLWAQPNPGGGSVFRVTLPLHS